VRKQSRGRGTCSSWWRSHPSPSYDAEGVRHGQGKISDAFSEYGPFGTWRTVENLTGLRLDHMAIIDYDGFRDLKTAVGGVDLYVPETVYDDKLDQT